MRLNISKQYDYDVELWDWTNPDDTGADQYVPVFVFRENIKVYIGVDPGSGALTMETPSLITAVLGQIIIINPKNRYGERVAEENKAYAARYPVPQINAYGQIFGYRYKLIDSGPVNG